MNRLLIGQLFSSKLFSVRCPKWRVQLPKLAHKFWWNGGGGGRGGWGEGGGGEGGGGGEEVKKKRRLKFSLVGEVYKL